MAHTLFEKADIIKKFQRRAQAGGLPAMLFSDIDRCFWHAPISEVTQRLYQRLQSAMYGLILLTGKSRENVEALPDVPPADILATAAGTELFIRREGQLQFDAHFETYLRDSGWDRPRVKHQLAEVLAQLQQTMTIDWQPQDRAEPTPATKEFKISFTIAGSGADMASARQAFQNTGVGRVLASGSHEQAGQYKVDIVPSRGGKQGALEYLLKYLPPVQIGFVAGNSGNDFAMLQVGAFPAILVGGASSEATAVLATVLGKKLAPKIFEFASNRGTQKIFVGEGDPDEGPRGILQALADPLLNPLDYHYFSGAL